MSIGFGRNGHIYIAFLVMALSLFFLLEVRGAFLQSELESGKACLRCHKDDYENDLRLGLIHQPCFENRCIVCHCSSKAISELAEEKGSPVSEPVSDDGGTKDENDFKVIDSAIHSAFSHSFVFSGEQVKDVLRVELWLGSELKNVEMVALAPLTELPRLVDDKLAPKIYDIKIEQVETGLSSSAKLSWKTDKPAIAKVRYGISGLEKKGQGSRSLKCKHTLELESLRSNRKYRVAVVAIDFFGNRAVSDEFELSTEKDYLAPLEKFSLRPKGACEIVKSRFYNVGNRYLALFELSRNLSISIGVDKNNYSESLGTMAQARDNQRKSGLSEAADSSSGQLHDFLVSEQDLNINNCLDCHKGIRREMSHPIDVLPGSGMKVPKDYRLLGNGRLSCMTCHVRHAGENSFRLVREQGKKFCSGCHSTY